MARLKLHKNHIKGKDTFWELTFGHISKDTIKVKKFKKVIECLSWTIESLLQTIFLMILMVVFLVAQTQT